MKNNRYEKSNMNLEQLKIEILTLCQQVQCGAKLAAEFSFIHRNNEYYDEVIKTIKYFPEIKYMSVNVEGKEAKNGWRNFYLFKYDRVANVIKEIEDIKNKDSHLYNFALGKLFGYNDFEVLQYLKKNCDWYYPGNIM